MENHHHQQRFIFQKVSRLFPSSLTSCHFRSIPDVAESSITISKKTNKIHHENDISSFKEPQQKFLNKKPNIPKHRYNFPPATPLSNRKEKEKKFRERKSNVKSCTVPNSSSANSGWFSSSDEKNGTFVSFSSNSGDSFRLKTSQSFRKYKEMKKIDETGRCSFSSVNSFDTLLNKSSLKKSKNPRKNINKKNRSKNFPEYELGSDQISAQLYYSSNRRRKTEKKRRKVVKKRNNNKSSVIEECYAVEKSSSDPYADFRASMVEMIVEKQMFGDLERLLQCFLSLNAAPYHGIILDVFSEICETLFSN